MIIPQGMAYAVLTGVPPIYGLYACIVPLLIYPIFGSSPFLSVGPVAIVSILMATGLSQFAEPMSSEFIQLAIFVSLVAGLIQVLLAGLKAGFLINFLSHPVLSGFTSAAAVIIIISQLTHALGVSLGRFTNIFQTIKQLLLNISNASVLSVLLFISSLFGILLLKQLKRSFPGALVFILGSSLLIYFAQLDSEIKIIGDVPSGFPNLINPVITDMGMIIALLPLCFIISFISFVESLAIAKSLAAKQDDMDINPDKELLGLGLAKVFGSFFQAFPNTGSISRSAINESAGAKTGFSSVIAAVLITLSVLFLTPLFYYIAFPVLAAIIVSAVIKLIDFKEARHLYETDRGDFWVMATTFLITLFLGIQFGIISGMALSIFFILKKVSRPHVAVLGKIDNSGIYRNIERFDGAITDDEILIIRYDDDIFFGNAEHFYNSILTEINKHKTTKHLVLDMSSISNIDSTGIHQFKVLLQNIRSAQIQVHLTGPKGPLRDRLSEEGITTLLGRERFHLTIEKSMQYIQNLPKQGSSLKAIK